MSQLTALIKKNWITWKRTPVESLLEILLAVFLMILLAIARLSIIPKEISSKGLYNLRHPLYSIASPDGNGQWKLDSFQSQPGQNMQSVMQYTGIGNYGKHYIPQMDPLGPYLFFPQHCYGNESVNKFSSPLIGYIETGSQLEQDLIAQLRIMFEQQIKLSERNQQVNEVLADFKLTIESLAKGGDPLKNENLSQQFTGQVQILGNFTFKGFKNKKELDDYIQDVEYGTQTKPGVCFAFQASQSENNRSYELELIFNDQMPAKYISLPNQRLPASLPTQFLPLFNDYVLYSWNGFSYMQNWAANTILKRHTNPKASIVAVTVPMKQKNFIQDDFEFFLRIGLISIIYLMYMPPLYRTVFRIVQEKESKAKETMLMMGMSEFNYWLSWFCYYTAVNTVMSTLSWLLLAFVIFQYSNAWLVWLVMWLFGQSLFGMILVAQSLFQKAGAAAYVTSSIYFGLALLESLMTQPHIPVWLKVVASLSPTVALSQTINVLVAFETSGQGSNFYNMHIWYMNYSVQLGLIMMVFNILIWYVLGVYLEMVLPQTYGQRKNPCFCFGRREKRQNQVISFSNSILRECFEQTHIETSSSECLIIKDLCKTYENGFQAVNNLSCTMYMNQIFCLLGHNGAGKTSTISILTGLIDPSSYSELKVFDLDIILQSAEVRKMLGVCPQHDVLFNFLTPKEHLEMFYDLKVGHLFIDHSIRGSEIAKMIKEIGLEDKMNTLASLLSGGNKRKLSVAIALIGGSKFVLLDEPTSGMDLNARHQLWGMLRKQKNGRIILMTTHYMDEADVLGDRIGIVHNGKISCLGSSLFLKNRFGVGYNLVLEKIKNQNFKFLVAENFGKETKCLSETQSQICFQLPHNQSHLFEAFFMQLDLQTKYSISVTTLEEVFLKIGHLEDPMSIFKQPNQNSVEALQCQDNLPIYSKETSFCNNLNGAVYKRISLIRRNKKRLCKEVFYPAFIMAYAIIVGQFFPMQRSLSRIVDPVIISDHQQILLGYNLLNKTELKLETLVSSYDLFEKAILSRKHQDKKTELLNDLAIKLWRNLKDKKSVDKPSIIASKQNKHNEISSFLSQKFQLQEIKNYSSLASFREQVFQFGKSQSEPFLYGSYELLSAHDHQYQFVAHLNLTSQEVTSVFPQAMYEAILKTATGDSDFSFKVKSSPYPVNSANQQITKTADSGRIVTLTAVSFSCIVTLLCSYYVQERISGLKHFQYISGQSLRAYWITNFIFDLITIEITSITSCLLFQMYDLPYHSAQISYLIYPFAILPFTYVLSFVFVSEAQTQSIAMFLNFMLILTFSTIGFVMRSVEGFEYQSDVLHWIFRLINPNYCLGSSIYLSSSADLLSTARASRGIYLSDDEWDLINVKGDIICLCFHFVFWTTVLVLIEWYQKIKVNQNTQKLSNNAISISKFRKVFDQAKVDIFKCARSQTINQLVAVNELTFNINFGECFCLLGVNGSGKSTTFKALTGEMQPTSGEILINGFDVWKNIDFIKDQIGYCPQQNLIYDSMTVLEHLEYFAAIRGVPNSLRQQIISSVIQDLNMQLTKNKEAGILSGGNKRKLCVATAIIGNTPIVLLDEPSAGMDPDARKFMWKVVKKIQSRKRSAILFTTHSIEEAEALSTKIGIMVKGGQFKCIGTASEIREKYGFGYVVDQKLVLADYEENLIKSLCAKFGQVDCLERYGSFIRLLIPKSNSQKVSIGKIFGVMELLKKQNLISEYSVTQSSLEQIFQSFANLQIEEEITHYKIDKNQLLIKF